MSNHFIQSNPDFERLDIADEYDDPTDWSGHPFVHWTLAHAKIFIGTTLAIGLILALIAFGYNAPVSYNVGNHIFPEVPSVLGLLGSIVAISALNLSGIGRRCDVPALFLINALVFLPANGYLMHRLIVSNWNVMVGKVVSVNHPLMLRTPIKASRYSNQLLFPNQSNNNYSDALAVTASYNVGGKDYQVTMISDNNELNVSDDLITFYYSPINPQTPTLKRGLSREEEYVLAAALFAMAVEIGLGRKLLQWQSNLLKMEAMEKRKLEAALNAKRSISLQEDGTHIQFYDPIPGAEKHEVILNDTNQEHLR